MVKRFLTAAMVFALIFATLPAARAGVFDDACSFQLAKAVKLGRGATVTSGIAGQIGGKAEMSTERECDPNCENCDKKTGECLRCKENYYLYDNACHDCPQYAKCDGTPDFTCPVPEYFKEGFLCHKCADLIPHCVACVNETKCTACEAPYVLSDDGTACVEPPTCAGTVAKDESVAMATDAATFAEALKSSKNVIFIANDISGVASVNLGSNLGSKNISGAASVNLGSKKLVGPKYFSDIAICKTEATPTVSFTKTAKMTISGGEINQISLKFGLNNSKETALSGSGTIKDASVSAEMVYAVVASTGKITLDGNVVLTAEKGNNDRYANQMNLQAKDGNVEIKGKTTLKGSGSDYGISLANTANVTVAKGGELHMDMPNIFVGVDLDDNSTFTANGPVIFDSPASSAIGYISTGNPVISLNANGNYIKTTYSGLMQSAGTINVNGSTTIECITGTGKNDCESCGCKAIDSHETYSSSVNYVTINAPLTLINFKRKQGDTYPTISGDDILSMVGGTLKINDVIESKAGYGKVLINGENQTMSAKGAILGASYLYGYGKQFNVSAGARMKIGGVCKKASSSGTIKDVTYDKAATTPPAPFNSGC